MIRKMGSKLFNQELNNAIYNAVRAGRKTVTVKDIRDNVNLRLLCARHKLIDPNKIQKGLEKMATLRGVINASGDVFMKNGKLSPTAEYAIQDKISRLTHLLRVYDPLTSLPDAKAFRAYRTFLNLILKS